MPKHEDMDFAHAPAWCDDCYDQRQRSRHIEVLEALVEKVGDLIYDAANRDDLGRDDWAEPRRAPRPPPLIPAPKIQKGGINIEQRRSQSPGI